MTQPTQPINSDIAIGQTQEASQRPPDAQPFVGRDEVFVWLEKHLARRSPTEPLLLYGPARIGKTAVFQEIAAGRLGPQFILVYIDFARLLRDSLSIFLHDLAQTAVAQLQQHGIPLPEPKQQEFVVNPYKAFQDHLLQPALRQLDGRNLLFLCDNLNVVYDQMAADVFAANTFEAFYRLIHAHAHAYTLFSLTYPAANGRPDTFTPFESIPHLALQPLTPAEVATLMRQGTAATAVQDVVTYIHQLTGGYPAPLQRLRQALNEWQAHYQLRQLTVADVAVVQQNTASAAAQTNTAPPLVPFTITRTMPSASVVYRSPYQSPPISRNTRLLGGALVLLAAAMIITGILFQRATQQQVANPPTFVSETAVALTSEALAAAIIAQTPSPTATQPPTDTPTPTTTPTDTPTPTLSPTPTETPTVTPTPTPDTLPTAITRTADGMVMRLIPGGTFVMGSNDDDVFAASDEKPQHEVTLDNYYMDQYEVTVAQYATFLNRLGTYRQACDGFDCVLPRSRTGIISYLLEEDLGDGKVQFTPLTGFAAFPINHISWYGAKAYCEAVGARLPTEAEWEYAARGDDGRLYPWGNEAPTQLRAVFNSEKFDNLKPVDALPNGQSAFNIFGMAGSMWEWTADWYSETYYATSPSFNPTGPETGLTRVIRGGAWPLNNEADRIRAANRSSLTPEFISSTVGFRCVSQP
ncbi:MAG: SUMF1/EgtB/PvdO family nonheme iron enzyme [Chloroflexi bacterium]|nr:SUMF1/EgtB/PvdO family nonheme iron enzyme [Chloroflexota bacterium]